MAGGHAEAARSSAAGRSWAGSGGKLLCGPRLAGPGGRAGPRAVIVCALAARGSGRGAPRGAAGGRASPRGWGLRRPRPARRAAWDGGTGRDGGVHGPGAPAGRSPALQTLGGGAGPGQRILEPSCQTAAARGLGRGLRSRPRFGGRPLPGATALEGGRPGAAGAAGAPAAPRASPCAPGGPGSGARHSRVPSERGPAADRRSCPPPHPPPLSFFGSRSGPATRRWGLTPSFEGSRTSSPPAVET